MCSSLRTNNKAINLITYLLKVKKAKVIHISRVYCLLLTMACVLRAKIIY